MTPHLLLKQRHANAQIGRRAFLAKRDASALVVRPVASAPVLDCSAPVLDWIAGHHATP